MCEPPTVVVLTQEKNIVPSPLGARGAKVVTMPDPRWARCDIKSVALLAQVLAKQAAVEVGATEVWMVEDGFVTEGGSSTAFIIGQDRRIVTRPLRTAINCEGSRPLGNRLGLPGLDGGGCRDRTDGHRSLASLQNEAARRGFRARNDLTQRMSKALAADDFVSGFAILCSRRIEINNCLKDQLSRSERG